MNTLLRLWKCLPENIRFLAVFLAIMLPFRSSIADWNYVPSGSMKPTMLEGEQIIVNKLAYDLKLPFTTMHLAQWNHPQRGDIVVFYSPQDGTRLVKRVVGLPGDTLEMRNEILLINGQPLPYEKLPQATGRWLPKPEQNNAVFAEENLTGVPHTVMAFPQNPAMRNFAPVTVPANHYYMLGDNRDYSKDSRYIGFVAREAIVGRSSRVAFSLDVHDHYWPRFERFLAAMR